MFKGLTQEITLQIQAKSGASPAVVVWIAAMALASLTAFVFLCVAGFYWLSLQFGAVFAGLLMAGIFVFFSSAADRFWICNNEHPARADNSRLHLAIEFGVAVE